MPLLQRDPIERLARLAAGSGRRRVAVRLTGFPYVPLQSAAGRADMAARLSHERDADDILQDIERRRDPAYGHAEGVALVLRGDFAPAAARLEDAVRRKPRDGAIWNDLAAARYGAALANDDPLLLADALGASRRALIERPSLEEAQFNHAVILESLGLDEAAIRAYEAYARFDGASGWAAEALQRVHRLRRPTQAEEWKRDQALLERAASTGSEREVQRLVALYPQQARAAFETIVLGDWGVAYRKGDARAAEERLRAAGAVGATLVAVNGDTFVADAASAIGGADEPCRRRLAGAHVRYYDARLLYRARQSAAALPMFREAEREFEACRSPMAAVGRYYVAQATFDAGQTAEAAAILDALLASAAPSHRALRAQLLWLRATIETRRGLLHQALAANREAMSIFQRLGEEVNACAMSTAAASILAVLGQRGEAWRMRAETFRRISRSGDPLQMQAALDVAARTEAGEEQWTVALSLLEAALDIRLRQNPRIDANALIWYALAVQSLGIEMAPRMMDRATAAAALLADPGHRGRATAEVELIKGIVSRRRDPGGALRRFDAYITFAAAHADMLFLPEAHLERALAYRAIGGDGAAERDLRQALALLEDRAVSGVEQRSTWFRTADLARSELVDLLMRRGDAAGAFATIDGARGKPFGAGSAAPPVPGGTLVVEYVALPDRLLIFTRDAGSIRVVVTPVGAATLRRAGDELAAAMTGRRSADTTALSGWLIAPVAQDLARSGSVMIVADRAVANVPFAALRMADGRYLVEHAVITLVPSASLLPAAEAVDARAVVAVGDPAFDPNAFHLRRLPAAAAEASGVAGLYGHAVLLIGEEATRENVTAAIGRAPVLHLATHAVAVPNEPAKSYLALASSANDSGSLSLGDIARGSLRSTSVVMLTGCRTAVAAHGAPVSSLALAFLAAGAPNVVGALWTVDDDDSTAMLTTGFHRALRAGAPPAAALREAQLALIRSPDPRFRHPSAWSGFQLFAVRREGGRDS